MRGLRLRDGNRRRRGTISADPERRMKWICAALLFGACADAAPGPSPRVLVSEAASGLAVGGGYAYYTSGNAIKRVSLDGGDPQTITDGQLVTGAIAVSDKYVYWANGQVQ